MTISLIQAKRLKELGARTKAQKYWGTMNDDSRGKPRITDYWTDLGIYDNVYPAYNAEELISILTPIYNSDWYGVVTRLADSNYVSLTECLCEELIHILEGTA